MNSSMFAPGFNPARAFTSKVSGAPTVLPASTTPGGRQAAILGLRGGAIPLADALDTINGQFFMARWGGRQSIIRIQEDGDIKRCNNEELNIFFSNISVEVPVINPSGVASYDYVPALKWWMVNPLRRQYHEVTFDPTDQIDRNLYYNQWRGFALQPAIGSARTLVRACRFMLWQLRHIVCNNDGLSFTYLVNWMAHLVQRPGIKMRTMLVLVSEGEGTGKTIVGEWLVRILQFHTRTVSDATMLLGKFNAPLEYAVFVLANELSFAGDHNTARLLKAFISDSSLRIEPKGYEAYMVPNRINLMLTTNAEWAVPAGTDARRFFVREVSKARSGNITYFQALRDEVDNGGLEAFLALLLSRDLSHFNPDVFPRTSALARQQIMSLEAAAAWLYAAADVSDAAFGHPSGLSISLPAFVSFQTLAEACSGWCRTNGKHPPSQIELGRLLTAVTDGKQRRVAKAIEKHNSWDTSVRDIPNTRGYDLQERATILAALLETKGVRL
jgi:hypothetical protein